MVQVLKRGYFEMKALQEIIRDNQGINQTELPKGESGHFLATESYVYSSTRNRGAHRAERHDLFIANIAE
jgi:hypothetical protein